MRLVVGEKPSVSVAISQVLRATTKHHGYTEGGGYLVSWCYGHLVQLLNPRDYEQWQQIHAFSQLPMLPDTWRFKIKDGFEEQFGILNKLMADPRVDEIICATDADREGECIFRYVYHLTGCKKPVKRLWVSSLEETAIKAGFSKLKSGSDYDCLFQAGFCRAKADWLVGMNGSTLFSMRYHAKLSIGRVQTPTLAMIVQRDDEVRHFVKQKYYTVGLDLGFLAESERINDEGKADTLCKAVNGKTAVLSSLKKEVKIVNPPRLYDLTALQRDANKLCGYTAKQTLDALQKLYEQKLSTYPRTDSQFLSDDMEQTTLETLDKIKAVFPQLCSVSQKVNVKRCIDNSKVSGHHAILPTVKVAAADLNAISDAERNILMLISARLIMATAEVHKYEAVKASVHCEGTDFTATGKTVLKMGWKVYEDALKAHLRTRQEDGEEKTAEKALPNLHEGQVFENVSAKKLEHWTAPPKPYTEDTLLSAMEHAGQDEYDEDTEKKGLGTPATRAGIIEGLVAHGYVERRKKQIIATERGVQLIQVVPEEVKSPKLTAEWEMQLQHIERGQADAKAFMEEIKAFVCRICEQYGTADTSDTFKKPEQEPIGKCPHCGADVKKGKFGFYCTGKCGMNIAKVYGKELTEFQLTNLLKGKQISYTVNGKKTIVLPQCEQHEYNGKRFYQWVTKRE